MTASSPALPALPIIDVSPLFDQTADAQATARAMDTACRDFGFFLATGHGVPIDLQHSLDTVTRAFFDLPDTVKQTLSMARGGRAWRGWFPVGGELTSGRPDLKEGLYLGTELDDRDPRVQAGLPLHGSNLFPDDALPEMRAIVSAWMAEQARVGHGLMEGLALGLGLPRDHFRTAWMRDPVQLFRLFHYPPSTPAEGDWGVGEHTDYGVLTLLLQDDVGGLQVRTRAGWIDVPPVPDAFVVNVGDMLERATAGRYRSAPHRVRASTTRHRYSAPFFFDPDWDARLAPLPLGPDERATPGLPRWDDKDPHAFDGTYGEYLLGKVSRVFPALFEATVATG